MTENAAQIEKTHRGYEVFGHKFSTRAAAEEFIWAEKAQSKLRSEQFLWESLRDVSKPKAAAVRPRHANAQVLQSLVTSRLETMAQRHRSWIVATVVVLAVSVVASFYLAGFHPAGRWFFMSFFGWWFLLERNFWRCPACDIKLAPGLTNSAVSIRKQGCCPNCNVSFSGEGKND